MKGKDLTDGAWSAPSASKDAARYSASKLKNKDPSRGRAREGDRQKAIELCWHSARAAKMPFLRVVATIEEQRLNIDRFRWIDEDRPIRELGA